MKTKLDETMNRIPWSDAERTRAIELYEQYINVPVIRDQIRRITEQINREFGNNRNHNTVSRYIHRQVKTRRQRRNTNTSVDIVRKLNALGATNSQIHRFTGIPKPTICDIIQREAK